MRQGTDVQREEEKRKQRPIEDTARIEAQRLVERRKGLEERPFDPGTEISADAKHISSRIVVHFWIIFVLLPFVLGLLWYIVVQSQHTS